MKRFVMWLVALTYSCSFSPSELTLAQEEGCETIRYKAPNICSETADYGVVHCTLPLEAPTDQGVVCFSPSGSRYSTDWCCVKNS